MLEWLSSYPKTSGRLACSPLKEHLVSYLAHLTAQRYPPKTMRKYPDYLLDFGEFVGQQRTLDVAQLAQSVEPFLTQLALKVASAPKVKHTLNRFLCFLRQTGVIPFSEPAVASDPHAELLEASVAFLRTQRALKERTARQIRGRSQGFMAFLVAASEASLRALKPEVIHRFLVLRGQQHCRGSMRTMGSSLRGYLSFLHRCQATDLDLSSAVILPRVYQHDQCPHFLTRPQIDAVLAIFDRNTPVGRRDYAMMLLLVVYGLRGTWATGKQSHWPFPKSPSFLIIP